jgi:hypothetical protein
LASLAGLWLVCLGPSLGASAGEGELRWNEIQVIGSHNSYHVEPSPAVRALIAAAGERQAQALEYTHPPFAEQLSARGVRQIELDLFHDPEGGRYAEPGALKLIRKQGRDPGPGPSTEPDSMARLKRPGMKVLHVPDVDFRTTVLSLVETLTQVSRWSRNHPRHVPIFILLELKEDGVPTLPTRPLSFDRQALQSLESEVLSVFSPEELITPDLVRGGSPTLRKAIQERGWPRLDQVRGKVAFALDNEDRIRDRYLALHPALDGQLLFVSVPESHPQAGWFKVNDPIVDFDRIRRLVSAGFLVRTRADADTRQARLNNTA